MRKLRIAMVAACPFPAAFASSGLVRELSLALTDQGHEVDVITYHLGDPNFTAPGITIHRIPPIPGYTKRCSGISPGKPFLDLFLCRKLLSVCRHKPFDLIHAHNYEAPPIAFYVRRKLGIPVVYHAHNTMIHELPTYFTQAPVKTLARHVGNWMDHSIPHRADQIITVSHQQTTYLKSIGIPSEKVSTVLPSINPELFKQGNPKRLRERLGIGDAPVILYTGGLQPYQNCQALIELLRCCHQEIPEVHLLILARSAPEWLRDLATSAGVSDRIHFLHGSGIDIEASCLALADVGVIPRLDCIGYPIKLLNYISARLPVVCFKGLDKGFRQDHELLVVPNGDVRSMAQAVVRLIKDPQLKAQLSENAWQTLKRNHSWDCGINKIEAVYSKLPGIR